jgi:hypothetical protein
MSANFGMSSIVRLTSAMVGRFEKVVRQRRAARTLEALPDYILRDIGYARDYAGMPSRMWSDLSR